jgi:hypothetical protein
VDRDSGGVNSTEALSEIVVFELPTKLWADSLMASLASDRLTWLQDGESWSAVGVLLNPEADDLAVLLRSAQAWLDRSGLAAMRFELDERMYVLEATRAAAAAG